MKRNEQRKVHFVLILIMLFSAGIIVLAAALFIFSQRTSNQLEDAIAELKRKGYRVSIQEYVIMCSSEEDAVIPWEKACSSLYIKESDKVWNIYGNIGNDLSGISDEEKQILRDAITENLKVLELMRESAARRCFEYHIDPAMSLLEQPLANYKESRSLFRLFVEVRARLAAGNKDWEEFFDAALLGSRISRKFAERGILVSCMIRCAFHGIVGNICVDTLAGVVIPERETRELIRLLDPDFLLPAFRDAYDRERIGILDLAMRFDRGEKTGMNQIFTTNVVTAVVLKPIIRQDTTMIQEWMVRIIEASHEKYPEAMRRIHEVQEEIDSISNIHFFIPIAMPGAERAYMLINETIAFTNAVRIALACKLFQQDTGAFPETLAHLTPAYLDPLPDDPFTECPFIYRRLPEGGFIVYSTGADGEDNGGYFQRANIRPKPGQNYDIGWLEPSPFQE